MIETHADKAVKSIQYANGTLEVHYRSGAAVCYDNVPGAVYERLKMAGDVGAYIKSSIRGKFPLEVLHENSRRKRKRPITPEHAAELRRRWGVT
jgi:hypothetical protein